MVDAHAKHLIGARHWNRSADAIPTRTMSSFTKQYQRQVLLLKNNGRKKLDILKIYWFFSQDYFISNKTWSDL